MNESNPITEFTVQVVGDSLFGADADGCASVSTFMSLRLWLEVEDNSNLVLWLMATKEFLTICFRNDWNWTVINGGANDIMPYCTENDCDEVLDDIITDSGEGLIPDLVEAAQDDGSKIILIGYYSVPKGLNYEPVILEVEILNDRYSELLRQTRCLFHKFEGSNVSEETPDLYR